MAVEEVGGEGESRGRQIREHDPDANRLRASQTSVRGRVCTYVNADFSAPQRSLNAIRRGVSVSERPMSMRSRPKDLAS